MAPSASYPGMVFKSLPRAKDNSLVMDFSDLGGNSIQRRRKHNYESAKWDFKI